MGWLKDVGKGLRAANTFGLSELRKNRDSDLMFQNYDPAPADISYEGISDSSGKLGQRYSAVGAGLGDFQQRLKEQALKQVQAGEYTPAALAALQAQQQGQNQLSGRVAQQQAAAMAQQQQQLAARGGISGGARERLAAQSARDAALGRQGVAAQGLEQRLGMQAQDLSQQQLRQQELQGSFAAQEERRSMADIQSAINDQMARQQFNLDKYSTQMDKYNRDKEAAEQERLAMTRGGLFGSGGFAGTGYRFG